jgi:hypothetical protein
MRTIWTTSRSRRGNWKSGVPITAPDTSGFVMGFRQTHTMTITKQLKKAMPPKIMITMMTATPWSGLLVTGNT